MIFDWLCPLTSAQKEQDNSCDVTRVDLVSWKNSHGWVPISGITLIKMFKKTINIFLKVFARYFTPDTFLFS